MLETSRTVLQVDSWGLRKGRELADRLDVELTPDELADCHAAVFELKPKLAESPANRCNAEWFGQLLGTAVYKSLHKQTRGRLGASAVAAEQIARQLAEHIEAECECDDPLAVAASTGKAVQKCRKAVAEYEDAVVGLGGGCGTGNSGESEIDAAKSVEIHRQVQDDPLLRKILANAGKFRRVAASIQRRKVQHGVDDLVGVAQGNKLQWLVHGELAALCIEEMETLELYRLATKTATVRDYRGVEPVGKGPIIVVVDESGSMSGAPIETAKGLALALGWVAAQQGRWVGFVGFSGGTDGTRLAMAPGKWDEAALMRWLKHFYAGGTTLDLPVDKLPNEYWGEFLAQGMPRGKTDVVLITDGVVDCPEEMQERYKSWAKAENVTTFGLVLNSGVGVLDRLCEHCSTVATLSVESGAVHQVLGV